MIDSDEMGVTILRPHQMLEKNIDGQQIYAIKFTDSEFSNIIFSYDRVEFIDDEENDVLTTRFNYTIHSGFLEETRRKAFEKELGDFLIEMVCDGIMKKNLIFSGGIDDENREDNTSSIDHE